MADYLLNVLLAGGMRDKLQLVRESILFFRFQFQAEKKKTGRSRRLTQNQSTNRGIAT